MIVIDDTVHHTGTNTEEKTAIPLSLFAVTCKTKSNQPFGETEEFEAIDEGHAISKYIQKNELAPKKVSYLKFKAKVVKEKRADKLNPPEPKAEYLGSAKKADAKTEKSTKGGK